MANSRKDNRGYVLRTGESQRKDGRYVYSYTDQHKKRRSIYAKSLAELRTKERKIVRDIEDGLDPHVAERMTLNDLYDRFISQKYDLKESTRVNYVYTYNHFVRETLGKRRLATIKYSDVKRFYYTLILEKQVKASSVESVHTQLHPAFQMAVRDGILRLNPTDGVMTEIKKSHIWDKSKRRALTIPQQKAFMNHAMENVQYRGWVPILTVLLGTGMRIGECLGLCWQDLDFDKRFIRVDKTLVYRPDEKGKSKFYISTPKTDAGVRTIPMLDDVYDALLTEYELQSCVGFNKDVVDGYSGFVFTNNYGKVILPSSVNRAIDRIILSYNEIEKKKARQERREAVLLPHFSAHNLRHTFCTRLCENESNLKVIQSIMGHADISTTMDIYAEATEEKKQEIVAKLENKIVIL